MKWIGHASFILEDKGKTVYIDPFKLSKEYGRADVIFITHSHFDHFSLDDIAKIADEKTEFVVPHDCKDKLKYKNVKVAKPLDSGNADGINFKAVAAYNTNSARLNFHPKANNWIGYIIDYYGTSFYHPGDTDIIDEMRGIKTDVALLPMGGTYTMDVGDAIKSASLIKAKTYVPMHYKMLLGKEGCKKAEARFNSEVKNSVVLKEVQEPIYSF